MRRLLALLCGLALGAGVAACGSNTAASHTSRAAAAATGTTPVHAQTQTLQFVTQTQNILDDLTRATHDLATHALPTSEIRADLKQLSQRASEVANAAWQELPAADPARSSLVQSAKHLAVTASTLHNLPQHRTTQSRLLGVTDPLTTLTTDIGRVAQDVTTRTTDEIHQDLVRLNQKLTRLAAPTTG